MRIFALFDDPDAIQKARDALEKEGRGDEVVEVVSPHLDKNERQISPVMGQQASTGPVAVNQAGQTAPRGTVSRAVATLGKMNLPQEQQALFEEQLKKEHAQVLVLETEDEDVDDTRSMLDDHGAQLVATT